MAPENEDIQVSLTMPKTFDSYFLLENYTSQGIRPSNVILNGTKLIYLKIEKDPIFGLNLSMKALGQELKKGYCCHCFKKAENWNYMGPYSEPQRYGANQMSSKDRQEFMKWHAAQEGRVFHFQDELVSYCNSDIRIQISHANIYGRRSISMYYGGQRGHETI